MPENSVQFYSMIYWVEFYNFILNFNYEVIKYIHTFLISMVINIQIKIDGYLINYS